MRGYTAVAEGVAGGIRDELGGGGRVWGHRGRSGGVERAECGGAGIAGVARGGRRDIGRIREFGALYVADVRPIGVPRIRRARRWAIRGRGGRVGERASVRRVVFAAARRNRRA